MQEHHSGKMLPSDTEVASAITQKSCLQLLLSMWYKTSALSPVTPESLAQKFIVKIAKTMLVKQYYSQHNKCHPPISSIQFFCGLWFIKYFASSKEVIYILFYGRQSCLLVLDTIVIRDKISFQPQQLYGMPLFMIPNLRMLSKCIFPHPDYLFVLVYKLL